MAINARTQVIKVRSLTRMEAMYLDGSKESAEAVAQWIEIRRTDEYRDKPSIEEEDGEFSIRVTSWDVSDFKVHPNCWVVRRFGHFAVLTPGAFQEQYEVAL